MTAPVEPHHTRAEYYRLRAAQHEATHAAAAARARTLSNARLAAFALVVLAAAWLIGGEGPRALRGASVVLAFVVFVALVRAHGRAREHARWQARLKAVAEAGEARVRRDWSRFAPREIEGISPGHPFARDLDVFGRASLFALMDTVSAYPGRPTLARWLAEPDATASEITERQAAVRELAPHEELREALHALARQAGELREASLARFLSWAEGTPWLVDRKGLRVAATLLPVLTIGSFAGAVAGVIPPVVWIIPLVASGVLLAMYRRRLHETLDAATARAIGLRQHAPMIRRLELERFEAPLLVRLQARIATDGGASAALTELESALALAEARAGGLGYAILALLALWDFHAVHALERWQRRAGRHVREWLAALGELEALAALATLAADQPEWAYPEVHDGDDTLVQAEQLGHPLLADEVRVANDLTIGPAGTILLVTGSNMSGKSTLLRAVGSNAVLALAGAPVCARRMRLPRLRMYTSMRIQDSLEQGLSLFMAELTRVRDIVAAARAERERPFLYLLDEILHGTNTAERQIAARIVLRHLVHAGALGMVTTHDLALAQTGELASVTRHVHFEESFVAGESGSRMEFDYRLREGPATSANAVRLLEMVGL